MADVIVTPERRGVFRERIRAVMDDPSRALARPRSEPTAMHRDGTRLPVELTVWRAGEDHDEPVRLPARHRRPGAGRGAGPGRGRAAGRDRGRPGGHRRRRDVAAQGHAGDLPARPRPDVGRRRLRRGGAGRRGRVPGGQRRGQAAARARRPRGAQPVGSGRHAGPRAARRRRDGRPARRPALAGDRPGPVGARGAAASPGRGAGRAEGHLGAARPVLGGRPGHPAGCWPPPSAPRWRTRGSSRRPASRRSPTP
nr:hypothetical protein [Angustibacter aerolatus]